MNQINWAKVWSVSYCILKTTLLVIWGLIKVAGKVTVWMLDIIITIAVLWDEAGEKNPQKEDGNRIYTYVGIN